MTDRSVNYSLLVLYTSEPDELVSHQHKTSKFTYIILCFMKTSSTRFSFSSRLRSVYYNVEDEVNRDWGDTLPASSRSTLYVCTVSGLVLPRRERYRGKGKGTVFKEIQSNRTEPCI